jgi:hypothetical protein
VSPPHVPRPHHLIETTAGPFLPHPRHRNRSLRPSTLVVGLGPSASRASGVSSATWWQAAQSTFNKAASPEILQPRRVEGAAFPRPRFHECSERTL